MILKPFLNNKHSHNFKIVFLLFFKQVDAKQHPVIYGKIITVKFCFLHIWPNFFFVSTQLIYVFSILDKFSKENHTLNLYLDQLTYGNIWYFNTTCTSNRAMTGNISMRITFRIYMEEEGN